MMGDLIHYSAVMSIAWSVFCRARRMDQATPGRLKLQHGLVLVLSLLSLPIFGLQAYAGELLALALCAYLWIDARRWRNEVPVGCPVELSHRQLEGVRGRGPK